MKIKPFFIFFGIWIIAGILFWFLAGNTLKYDIYSETNGTSTYLYSENISTIGRILVSAFAGLIASVAILFFRWFFGYLWRILDTNKRTKRGQPDEKFHTE